MKTSTAGAAVPHDSSTGKGYFRRRYERKESLGHESAKKREIVALLLSVERI
jgi:hypothetical protein